MLFILFFLCGGSTRNCSSYTSILGRRSVNIVLYVPQCLFKLELSHCVLRQTLKSKTLFTASSILLLNCIANQVTCLPCINHTVLTRGIEKNRIVSSEMVEHLCFKSVKQSSVFYFLSCAQSTNPSGFLIELFNKCKTPNEVSCPPASRNHCRNISTNYQSYLMVKMHLGVWNTLIRFFSIKHNPGKKVKHSSMYLFI